MSMCVKHTRVTEASAHFSSSSLSGAIGSWRYQQGACYTGEVDVYGGFWGHVRSHVLGVAKVFKNEEFKIPWQRRSCLGLGGSLPSLPVTFLYTCPNPHPGPLSPSSQACPPSLSQDPSLCRSRVTCPGPAQGDGFPAGPLCIQQG